MIELYSGTPGSGKSLHAAYEIITNLRLGRNVIANFPINAASPVFKKRPKGGYFYIDNREMSVELLKRFARDKHTPFKEHQTLLIIDECGALFNPRAWKDADRMGWLLFFSQHRKLGYDVLLISQADIMLDKQIRSQIEVEHRHRAVKNYKTFGWLLSLVCGGLFMDVEYWYPCRLKIGTGFFRYQAKKAAIYDTYRIFE